MAAIDDLISQIEDPALQTRLREEVARLTKEKKFGLVFEDHLPELTPVYNAKIRVGSLVARRDGLLTDTWRVLRIAFERAICYDPRRDEQADIALSDLVVVRRFGEPIFPALKPMDQVQNGPADVPWHTLIEADNYHALQLLEYLCAGQVDCIYIDPPYNTGARDWKYNNDFVDEKDSFRHSKWLAFMKRRLKLAKQLLNPENSVLIVTIDEKEYLRLGLLLEEIFADCKIQMISTMINPANVARAGAFGRSNEYIFFVMMGNATPQRIMLNREWVSAKGRTHTGNIRWDLLRRSGEGASRKDAPGCFYPIYINPNGPYVEKVGTPLPNGQSIPESVIDCMPVLPIRKDGSEGRWQWAPDTFQERMNQGRVRITGSMKKGFVVSILKDGEFAKIERGEFQEIGRNLDGSVVVDDVETRYVSAVPGNQWRISTHDATQYGSRLLGDILPGRKFPFPKSIYAVRDAIRFFVEDKPNALIVDFFAGSGSTLNAVNLLNVMDGGKRQCIMITNNEVSEQESNNLKGKGLQPGESEWEQQGICQLITWPRSKYTILGQRDNGTQLEGEYFTDKTTVKEKARIFKRLGVIDPQTLTTAAQKQEIVDLIEGIPKSHIKKETAFFVSEDEGHTAAVLFDETQAEAFLEALEERQHITHFYIITQNHALFQSLKDQINELLGPIEVQEEEKRPMSLGFPANLAYFKLDFLEKDQVALGQQFQAILPVLWMRAGAFGPRPEMPDEALPAMLLPVQNPFAVLLDETRFADFQIALAQRESSMPITHLFLVTDSAEAFQEMAAQLTAPHIIQLYRDYLENFTINQGESA